MSDPFPDTDSPVWILGKDYSAKYGKKCLYKQEGKVKILDFVREVGPGGLTASLS